MSLLLENYLPVVQEGGLNTNKDVVFGGNLTVSGTTNIAAVSLTDLTVTGNTTIGNASTDTLAITGLSTATAANTTGATFAFSNTGVYTGTGAFTITANSATSGVVSSIVANGLTTGSGLAISSTGTGLTSGSLLSVSSATTGAIATNGAVSFTATGAFTSTADVGFVNITANSTTAGVITHIVGNALTTGVALSVDSTGTYTGTGLVNFAGSGTTTGIITSIVGAAATLTTGRYLSVNDGATEVFGIGANGHIHSKVSAVPPTITVTNQAGITAAAITAGGSDTCGVITTTGTSTGATVLDVTFGKTYTTAPKAVILTPANASASMPNTNYYVSAVSATGFTITVPAAATYAATPSWMYLVIA